MTTTQPISPRRNFWKTVLLFGALHFLVMSYGAFVIERLKGGCQFVIPAYFMALPVVLSILLVRRFGAGTAVFLPYAIIGFFPVYYMDYIVNRTMLSPWGALAWSVGGLLVGLSADLAYRLLPRRVPEKWRAVVVGVVIGAAIHLTTVTVIAFFYAPQPPESHYYQLTTGIAYSLSWLIVNGGFAGYTAYALTKKV